MLSVLMTTYNDAEFIPQSIDSVLSQSYRDFELIIINDGSTDNTEEIIEKYKRQDSRIKLLKNTKNCGMAKSINTCCKVAKGKYIYWISSDDWINQGFFQEGIESLESNPDVGICIFETNFYKDGALTPALVLPNYTKPTKFSPEEVLKLHRDYYYSIPGCAAIVKSSELRRVGYFQESLGYYTDLIAYTLIEMKTGILYNPKIASNFSRDREGQVKEKEKKLRADKSAMLIYLKKDKQLFNVLCFSTFLPKIFHSSSYKIFLKPKHWDMAIPMIYIKLKLLFIKLLKKTTFFQS